MSLKYNKKKKRNIKIVISTETNPAKKKILLKRRNKSVKKRIKLINFMYYIIAIALSIPMHIGIRIIISEITNLNHYIIAYLMCMLFYCTIIAWTYILLIVPIIVNYKKEMVSNNALISDLVNT